MKRRTPLERLDEAVLCVERGYLHSNKPLLHPGHQREAWAAYRRALAAYRLHLARCAEYAVWNALASFTSEDLMHAASRAAREAVRKGKA